MEKVAFSVPTIYADHHVLRVREALEKLPGVAEIRVSAALKRVVVAFDPASLSPQHIEDQLKQAGYPFTVVLLPTGLASKRDPAWDRIGPRTTETNRAEIEMAGEFRLY